MSPIAHCFPRVRPWSLDPPPGFRRRRTTPWLAALALLAVIVPLQAASLDADDLLWLRRTGYGLDASTLERYQRLGRAGYLRQALQAGPGPLPTAVQARIDAMPALHEPPISVARQLAAQQQALAALPAGAERLQARRRLQQQADDHLRQARDAVMLQAVYGANPLYERMVWFWLNHFSVDAGKGHGRWLAADYAQQVIRPHALGHFRDLVLATLQSPAMLEFLDNAQNARGRINENYARELMELHTLGVGSGYTQQDVQQLASILTGAGLAPFAQPARALPARWRQGQLRQGLFEFNPARHDFGDKRLLGQTVRGRGYDEIRQAVDILVRQPACAHFISSRLAQYFVGDHPDPRLVRQMADTFHRSDGDIARVLETLFDSPWAIKGQPPRYEDPMRFLVAAERLRRDDPADSHPERLNRWLGQMGEALFARTTPDGWPLDSMAWSSSGQLAKRFEVARALARAPQATTPAVPPAAPDLRTGPVYVQALQPHLSAPVRQALALARNRQDWNTYLLASPDFNSD